MPYSFGGEGAFPTTMRVVPTPAIITAPTYVNCVHHSLVNTKHGIEHRVSVTAAGVYRAVLGVYEADAEL
jgi:hypothetical protein